MADLGLLSGLAAGLQQGTQSYQDTSRYMQDLALRKRQEKLRNSEFQADLKSKGLIQSDEGLINYTPEKQQQVDLQGQQTNQATQELDPTSDYSSRKRSSIRSALDMAKPGLGSHLINDQMSGTEADQVMKEVGSPLLNMYGQQARMEGLIGVKREGLDETRNQNAIKAGQTFENDPIIKQTKQTTNSLNRAESILYGKEPVTAKSFALLQQDMINAMAPGGAATEGKVNREMVNTLQEEINNIGLKFGQVKDLRTEQPQVVENLKHLISQVKSDYAKAQSDQVKNISDSLSVSSNPKVQRVTEIKRQAYQPQDTIPSEAPMQGGTQDFNSLSDDQLYKLWKQRQGK